MSGCSTAPDGFRRLTGHPTARRSTTFAAVGKAPRSCALPRRAASRTPLAPAMAVVGVSADGRRVAYYPQAGGERYPRERRPAGPRDRIDCRCVHRLFHGMVAARSRPAVREARRDGDELQAHVARRRKAVALSAARPFGEPPALFALRPPNRDRVDRRRSRPGGRFRRGREAAPRP